MRRGERDARGEDVLVVGRLVGARPVRSPPVLVGLGGVVGVDAHELVRHEHALGDLGALAVECLQADAGERRQQHREVELLLALASVERLVEDTVGLDLLNVGAGDPVDPALGEQRGVEDAARRDVAAALQVHAAHAEVAELVLVRDPGDLGFVAHAAVAQLELEVDDVLERRALAGAGAVADADQEAPALALAHPLDLLGQRRRGLRRVPREADREAVPAIGAEALGLVEAQRRPGRVDQEVVRHPGDRAVGRLRRDVRGRVVAVALRMDLPRGGQHELDPGAFVDRGQGEGHLRRLHQPDADPDVRGHPVVVRPRRDHRHRVAAPSQLRANAAAVCPEIPAPSTTTRLTPTPGTVRQSARPRSAARTQKPRF